MKKGKIAKAALAVLSMMTIGAAGAGIAGCDGCNSHVHNYGDWYIVTEPTLTDNGTAERECPTDGNKDTQSLPKLTDTSVWTEDTDASVDPTHTTDGSKTFTSEYGSVTITVPKNADAHSYGKWSFVDGKTPTTTAGGQIQRVCGGDNSHTETKDVPALSDDTFWTRSVTKEPTHQGAGTASYTNATYGVTVEGIEVPRQNHTFGAWKITVEPGLTAPGKAERVCTADGCAEDETATEKMDLPALSDTSFWTKGEHVDADYNHPESDTYKNEEFNLSVKVIGAAKLPVIYDGKIYHSVHVTPNVNGSISIEVNWNSASLSVNSESVGFGDAYPFMGKFVLELLDPETGLVKVSQYDKISSGTGSGSWGDDYEEGDIYSARADVEYSDTVSNVIYAYVDMTTGIIIWQSGNSWNRVHVAIPTESVLSGSAFNASACKGDLAISYNNGGTAFNMLVMGEDGVAFGVSITDINGNTLTASNCFDTNVNETGTVLVKDKAGKIIKAYALNTDNEWVVADGLQGTYKNGAEAIVVDGASGVKIGGASHKYEIVSNSADSRIISVIIDNVYYEYTLTGDGISANGGAYTVEAPKVTVTYDFKGVTPSESITAVNEVSKKVPLTLAVPENAEMQFIGWYTDSACTVKVTLTDGKFIPTETVTLYAKWSEKVVITIEDSIGGAKTVYAGEGELFGDVIKIYTKNQVDEASKKYFVGWYTKNGDNLISDTDLIDGDITIYAKWENVHELYGTYGGKQLLSAGTVYEVQINVSTIGEISGFLDLSYGKIDIEGTILGYTASTQVVEWAPKSDPTKTYLMWFDAESGVIVIPDTLNYTVMDQNPFVAVKGGSVETISRIEFLNYAPNSIIVQGRTKLIDVDGTIVLLCDDNIYSKVSISDSFGGELGLDSVQNSKTLVVKQGEVTVLAIGTEDEKFSGSSKLKALDAYYGVYTVNVEGNDVEFKLDGLGNVTWDNGKEGIYSFLNTEDDGKTNVLGIYERVKKVDTDTSVDDDGDVNVSTTVTFTTVAYHELRLGATNSFVKPMATIKIEVIGPQDASMPDSFADITDKNINMDMFADLPDGTEKNTAFAFKGFFLDEGCTQKIEVTFIPRSANVTIYAKYANPAVLTIVYNNGEQDKVLVCPVGEGVDVFEKDGGKDVLPVKAGFAFVGWFTKDGTNGDWGEQWTNGSIIEEDMTLYAKWNVAPKFSDTYAPIALQGTNASGTSRTWDRHDYGITVDVYGKAVSKGSPIGTSGNEVTVAYVEGSETEITITTGGQVINCFIDPETGLIIMPYTTVAAGTNFDEVWLLNNKETGNYSGKLVSSYWNYGKTRVIEYKYDNDTVYRIFVNYGQVYFGVTFEDADGNPVAGNVAYTAPSLYVKQGETLVAKFAYDGTVMNELDDYEDIIYTGAMGNLTVNGVAKITLNGVEGTYSINKEAEYTADAYIGGSYYEVTLNKDASTYTIVKRMVTVTFDTEFDTANVVSGDMNKNITFTLPVLTDATHVFRGWYIEDEAQLLNGEFTPVADVTLHAKWDVKVILTVVYDKTGWETDTIEYGVGDTVAPAEPTFTDGQVFEGWYLDADFKTPYTVGEITADTTIYCKWQDAVAMFGEYKGFETWGGNASNIASTIYTQTGKSLTIEANGTARGGSWNGSGNVTTDYNPETGFFTVTGGTSEYLGYYDIDNGIIAGLYTSGGTSIGADFYIFFKGATAVSVSNTDGSFWNNGNARIVQVSVTGWKQDKVNIFVYNNKLYANVKWTSTDGDVAAKDVYKANQVSIFDDKDQLIAEFVKVGNQYLCVPDSSKGTYTNGSDSFKLDGGESIVWGDNSGTYKVAPEGAGYTYDVTLKNPKEYYQVTVTGNTFIAVKPEAVITFDLGGNGTNFTRNQNLTVELALSGIEDPTADGFVFQGWYSGEGGTGNRVYWITPTTTDPQTVYAKWEVAVTLTVVYGEGNQTVLKYVSGTTTAPVAPEFKDGIMFDHWYTSDDGGVTEKDVYTPGAITENTTIYCKTTDLNSVFSDINLGSGTNGFKAADGMFVSNNKGAKSTTATLVLTVKATGTLKFSYYVSSEASYDKANVKHTSDGTTTNLATDVSGTSNKWETVELTVKEGDTITITYTKDSSGDRGDDCVKVKSFSFVAAE